MRTGIACALLATLCAAAAPSGAGSGLAGGRWRHARWGMTPDEVLAAFPGEAERLARPIALADGNVVECAIHRWILHGRDLTVRFVFEGGRLALVSLRTPADRFVDAGAFEELERALAAELGSPAERTADAQLVELRQTRWHAGGARLDLKYLPGVVAIVIYPARDVGPRSGPN